MSFRVLFDEESACLRAGQRCARIDGSNKDGVTGLQAEGEAEGGDVACTSRDCESRERARKCERAMDGEWWWFFAWDFLPVATVQQDAGQSAKLGTTGKRNNEVP